MSATPCQAHKSSDAYLFFDQQPDQTTLRWDIALRDLDVALALDSNGDRALTWGEVRAAWPRIDALVLASLAVPGCRFEIAGHALEQRNDGAYAVLQLKAPCQLAPSAPLHYGLFADIDPTHRGIVRHTVAGVSPTLRMLVPVAITALQREAARTPVPISAASGPALPAAERVEALAAPSAPPALQGVAVAAASAPASMLDAAGASSTASAGASAAASSAAPTSSFPTSTSTSTSASASTSAIPALAADAHAPSFIGEGVHHIVTGYDHLLFLLCLLLPSVLRREQGHWQAVAGWRQALFPVAKTVTLFTLAHSVTLALAALGWVKLSPSFVEPAIAATIMLAALDNLRPTLLRWRGWVTFCFGLIHGFGFAGVLGELQLPPAQFGWALFQFNLGLELGQLCLVLAVVPLLFALRRNVGYVPLVLRTGSALALLMAAVWLAERTSDWRLLPA